jgi:hypothetical protein
MSTLPQPTPVQERDDGVPVCRVNELVLVKFANDPAGLVKHLCALPAEYGGLNAVNENGWTALMRASRDGLKKHVEALVNAGANVTAESTQAAVEKGVTYPEGSTAVDLCLARHSALSDIAHVSADSVTPSTNGKQHDNTHVAASPHQSTKFNASEIITMLTNAEVTKEEEIPSSRDDARLKLQSTPNYFGVKLVNVNEGYHLRPISFPTVIQQYSERMVIYHTKCQLLLVLIGRDMWRSRYFVDDWTL